MNEMNDQAATLRAAAALKQEKAGEAAAPRAFDFRQPPPHSRAQLRSLKLLHDPFCAPLAKALAAASGLPCKAALTRVEAGKFKAEEDLAYAAVAAGGQRLLLGLQRGMVWMLLERLLGGKAQEPGGENRPYSAIERRVLTQLLFRPLAARYGETWARIAKTDFEAAGLADDPYSVPGLARDAETAVAQFSVTVGNCEGKLAAVLPFSFLKPLMPELDPAKILGAAAGAEQAAGQGRGAMLGIPVTLRALLGSVEIKLRDLNGLAPGDVLRLDARPDDEVTVEIEGQPRFAGKAGRAGKGLGIQLTRAVQGPASRNGDKNGNGK